MRLKKFALKSLIILAAAVALCILFSGTIRTLTTPKVRFAPVKNGKFESVTELSGKIVFPEEEELSLTVPEGLSLTITRVSAAPGKAVKKGEKLLTAVVTDAEKTLSSLQQEIDSAQKTLESWERKNGALRLSRNEQRWMEAWEAAREAEKKERAARLDLLTHLEALGLTAVPESLPEDADEETAAAFEAWREADALAAGARRALEGLNRFAPAEETWNLLEQKKETEGKLEAAEQRMMQILLLAKKAEAVTAPHAGYVVSAAVEKGGIYTGDGPLLTLTPEDKAPVIRADVSNLKQSVQKGAVIIVDTESWGRVETRVTSTGISDTGHPYIDAEYSEDLTWALGPVSAVLKDEIHLRLSSRAQEATCLIPSAAVRGSGDGRYVYVGETETSALAGTRIAVRKVSVTVLAENASTVSVSEDLSRSKVLYMEDRAISENGTVMLYEE